VDILSAPGEFIAKKSDQATEYLREKLNLSPSVAAGINTTLQTIPQFGEQGRTSKYEARAPAAGRGIQESHPRYAIEDRYGLGAKFAPSEVTNSTVGSLVEGVGGKIKTQQGASIQQPEQLH